MPAWAKIDKFILFISLRVALQRVMGAVSARLSCCGNQNLFAKYNAAIQFIEKPTSNIRTPVTE
jgi:hypothetical protein